jgi:anti-sigma28 factor (negative regulator of flagellin synthesis)
MPGPRDITDYEADGLVATEDAYSADYLRDVANDEARQERLEELKRRIELGAYKPDATSIAEGMLSRAVEDGLELEESSED